MLDWPFQSIIFQNNEAGNKGKSAFGVTCIFFFYPQWILRIKHIFKELVWIRDILRWGYLRTLLHEKWK